MRRFLCVVCCCVLLLGSGCAAPAGAPSEDVPPALPPAADIAPMTLAAGTSPLTGLPLREGQSALTRPLGVVLDNVRVALPQRGIGEAAIVYELVAESGITRLLAVYEDAALLPETGPVRSVRDAHVQMALPLGAMLLHVGGSIPATDMLEIYHYGDRSINGYYETGALELDADRNATVAIEHCWFTSGALFSEAAKEYSLSTQQEAPQPAFQFVPQSEAPRTLTGGEARCVSIRFSSYDTTVLTYNPDPAAGGADSAVRTTDASAVPAQQDTRQSMRAATGLGVYEKTQFGAPQVDENTGGIVGFTNVLVLFADIGQYPDGVLAKVDLTGGTGWYLSGGRYEPVRWEKGLPEQPLRILTPDGANYVAINPGATYVALVDLEKEKYFTMQTAP